MSLSLELERALDDMFPDAEPHEMTPDPMAVLCERLDGLAQTLSDLAAEQVRVSALLAEAMMALRAPRVREVERGDDGQIVRVTEWAG